MWSKTEIIQGMSVKTKLSRRNGVESKKIGVIVKFKFFRCDGVKSKKNWRDNLYKSRNTALIVLLVKRKSFNAVLVFA